jgi:hypothetical protein
VADKPSEQADGKRIENVSQIEAGHGLDLAK